MSQVSKFLRNLLLFVILVVIVDNLLGYCLQTIYFSQKKGQFAQTTYSVDSTHQDVLIFGSSRAVRHYSPSIISQSLHLSCYNVGRDGQMIPYYSALQETIFKRYKPKLVILDINPWELSPGEEKYEKLSILFPYCREHPEMIKYMSNSSPWEKYKLLSRTYPYNSSLFILGYNTLFADKVQEDDNGYVPLPGKMTQAALTDFNDRMKNSSESADDESKVIDERSLGYYEQFLRNTEREGIKTYVVISPTILKQSQNYKIRKFIAVAAKFRNVTFLNFSTDPKYNYQFSKFSDVFHLNKEGSEEFTNDLIRKIK